MTPSRTKRPRSLLTRDRVKMTALWITLLLLHQAYSLIPVITVGLGESVTLTCISPDIETMTVCWYKQSAGEMLTLIVIQKSYSRPVFERKFSSPRFSAIISKTASNLTILATTQEDEGMYHCAVMEYGFKITWRGTYLSIKGNPERRSDLTVVQGPTVSDPLRPGDSMTLQCSVLSDPDSKTCPRGHSVFWFRARSNESGPDVIYAAGHRRDGCEERSASQKSCVYHFSKNVSSSDAGTYYCAVDTCGRLLFGDGTKVDVDGKFSLKENTLTFLLCAALTLTLIVIAVLIHAIKTNDSVNKASDALRENADVWRSGLLKSLKRDQVYSAVVFTSMKSKKAKAAEKERIYAAVKAFGLDQ